MHKRPHMRLNAGAEAITVGYEPYGDEWLLYIRRGDNAPTTTEQAIVPTAAIAHGRFLKLCHSFIDDLDTADAIPILPAWSTLFDMTDIEEDGVAPV